MSAPEVTRCIIHAAIRKMQTPKQLNRKWIRAVRFALRPEVKPAIIATTHEPIFEPMVR